MDTVKLDEYESGKYTINDIYNLPNGQRAELIDGELYMMAAPGLKHQRLVGMLYQKIANYIDENKGDCEPFVAPFAVFLNDDDKTYTEPDLSVICDRDKLTDDGCHGAPDWVIEIVSPNSRRMDDYLKLFKYRTAGVREYWIVDYEKNRITVYNFENDEVEDYMFTDKVNVGIYEDFVIDFSELNVTNDR